MRIRKEVMERMRGRSREIKPRIISEMGVTKQSVDNWFKQNRDNGWLTSKAVLRIISEVLNLTDDEILTSELVEETETVKSL